MMLIWLIILSLIASTAIGIFVFDSDAWGVGILSVLTLLSFIADGIFDRLNDIRSAIDNLASKPKENN